MKALLLLPWWLHLPAFHSSPALQSSVLFSSSPCRHRLLPKGSDPAASEEVSSTSHTDCFSLSCWRPLILTKRECGQNPRLFLKEEKGFGKVHQGREVEGNRSLHQVLQAGHQGQVHHSLPACHKAAGGEGDGADREGSWRLQGPGPSHH